MKKLIFLFLALIPINVFAYVGPLDDEFFTINNQTSSPFSITIGSNSTTDVTFHLDYFYTHSIANYDIPGSYLFFSIESNKKLSINRKYSFGSSCSTSCFSNDDYLFLNSDDNGYSYVYYFNIVKWARTVGTQVDQFSVADVFTFHNLESGTATVYIYGSYANNTNQIPNIISNVETKQQIIIGNESIESSLTSNANRIISAVNDMLNDCQKVDLTLTSANINPDLVGKYLINTGDVGNSSDYGISYYYEIIPDASYVLTSNVSTINSPSFCLYDKDLTIISCTRFNNQSSWNFTANSNVKYFRTTLPYNHATYNLRLESDEICKNKIDDVNNSINDLNNNITNSSVDNPNSDLSEISGMVAENGVITNLITLPITLYQAILNSVNGTCSSYSFGQLFGTDISFSCISLQTLLGNTIFSVIDMLFSGFTIYKIAKKMIKVFNNMSSLKEGDVLDD